MSEVQRLVVTVEMEDGTIHEDLRVKNPALCAFDIERAAKKWPTAQEGPLLWQTFVAWRQLVNDDLYRGTFKDFRDHDCADVSQADQETVDPTRPEDDSTPSSSSPQTPDLPSTT